MAAPARTAPSIAHRRVCVGDEKDFNAFRKDAPIKPVVYHRTKYHPCRARANRRSRPKGDISIWWGPRGASAHANPLHQKSRVDALSFLNDMTLFSARLAIAVPCRR